MVDRRTVRLTKSAVEDARPAAKDYYIWDAAVHGFGVRIYPSGKRVYVGRWGLGRRDKRQVQKIGEHGMRWSPDKRTGRRRTLTVDLAREIAIEWRSEARRGIDPAGAADATRDIPTLRQFVKERFRPFIEGKRQASTVTGYERQLRRLLTRFGARRLDLIGPEEVETIHAEMFETPFEANRTVDLLSTIFSRAIKWRTLPHACPNPCKFVEQYAELPKERRLSDDEMARIGEALMVAEESAQKAREADGRQRGETTIAALRTIIFTGARPGEIAALQLAELDIERRLIVKRHWKTRGKTRVQVARAIPLSDEAVIVLKQQLVRRLGRDGDHVSPFVFPSRLYGQSISVSGLDGTWEAIREKIGLDDVRLSDLGRHNFASEGVELGYTTFTLMKLLGHSQESTTHRYAHLGQGAAASAAGAISARIAERLKRKPRAD